MEQLTKKFYRIGDVSELLGLPQSTIRFWEKEFSELRPRRNGGGDVGSAGDAGPDLLAGEGAGRGGGRHGRAKEES